MQLQIAMDNAIKKGEKYILTVKYVNNLNNQFINHIPRNQLTIVYINVCNLLISYPMCKTNVKYNTFVSCTNVGHYYSR